MRALLLIRRFFSRRKKKVSVCEGCGQQAPKEALKNCFSRNNKWANLCPTCRDELDGPSQSSWEYRSEA